MEVARAGHLLLVEDHHERPHVVGVQYVERLCEVVESCLVVADETARPVPHHELVEPDEQARHRAHLVAHEEVQVGLETRLRGR